LENMLLANARFISYFSFCRIRNSLGITPAQAVGFTDRAWTLPELPSATIQSCATFPAVNGIVPA
jgi:hypothetical protein